MTNSDKHNNLFCACAIAKFSQKSFKHNKEHNSNIKRQIGGVLTNRLLDVWKTLLILSNDFSSNAFSQNIIYCSVAFSLLLSIVLCDYGIFIIDHRK